MIQAQELRIGNLILNHKGEIETVKAIGINDYIWFDKERNLLVEYCQQIPLTEEWLLKLGFKTSTLIHMLDSYTLNGNILFKGEDSFRYFGTATKIKYVHQLQNLYFALTNEELTFKP
jgi:hypothetical protein